MPWGAAIGAVGSIISSDSGGSSQTTTNEVDPRLAAYLYGEDGKGGLLSDVSKWYQANRSGLNPQMAQGLNTQWATLNDPATMGGYKQMSALGSGLMGAPVMGNPFSDGRVSLRSGGAGVGSQNLGLGGGAGAVFGPQGTQQFPSFPMQQPAQGGPTGAPGPFTSAPPAYQTAAPPPPPADSGMPDIYDRNKMPTVQLEPGNYWGWGGNQWGPVKYETGGA